MGPHSHPAQTEAKPPSDVSIREFDDSLAGAFYEINANWIAQMFTLEDNDRAILSNPGQSIIERGGVILFVVSETLGVMGTCALIKIEDGCFELTKMAVTPEAQGQKAGEFLLNKVLERAHEMDMKRLYLLTNRKCAAAIHLYEKLGFVHDAAIMSDYGRRYARCDVAMSYPIASA